MSALIYFMYRSTRPQHLLHWDSIWDWTFSPLSRFCSRKFCRTPRSIPPAAHVSPSRYQAHTHDPHLSAAVAEAGLTNEDVLAIAIVGEGAAAVALEHGHNLHITQSIFILNNLNMYFYICTLYICSLT